MAYLASRLVSGADATAVYDYSSSQYFNFSGSVSTDSVNVYDYEQRCYVSGLPSSLYHYGNRRNVQLEASGRVPRLRLRLKSALQRNRPGARR